MPENPFEKTDDAVKVLHSKNFKWEHDQNTKFCHTTLKIKESLGDKINDIKFEEIFIKNQSNLISFIGPDASKIFWKTCKQKSIYMTEIKVDENGIVALFCQSFIMKGMSETKDGKFLNFLIYFLTLLIFF